MKLTRRDFSKFAGAGVLAAAAPSVFSPAIAQNTPLKIGIIAPRSGVVGTAGECGIRSVQWATERLNKDGGIGGRRIELAIEEETNPKDTIERFRRLILQEKVEAVHGLLSTGVSLGVAPVAEEEQALLVMWDGTTQDGVKEMMPNPKYVFRSTDNECEAVMGSLLAIKHFKGKFKRVAGINPDYSYGRNNWEAFKQILARYGVEPEVAAEQWPKVGTMDLTSHIAALKASKPDLIFSSMLFADLPVFMKQGHAAGLFDGVKLVLPAAGWQINLLKKEFMPEGIIFGHNTLYFDHPQASAAAEGVRAGLHGSLQGSAALGSGAGLFRARHLQGRRRGRAKGHWQMADKRAGGGGDAGPRGRELWRQGPLPERTRLPNRFSIRARPPTTINTISRRWHRSLLQRQQLQKPPGVDFWDRIKNGKMPV